MSIYMAFDIARNHRDANDKECTEAMEVNSYTADDTIMKPHFYMELLIQIYQSFDFLKGAEISDRWKEIQFDFKFTKPGIKKLLLLDLDETLAHCVTRARPNDPNNKSDVEILIQTA